MSLVGKFVTSMSDTVPGHFNNLEAMSVLIVIAVGLLLINCQRDNELDKPADTDLIQLLVLDIVFCRFAIQFAISVGDLVLIDLNHPAAMASSWIVAISDLCTDG